MKRLLFLLPMLLAMPLIAARIPGPVDAATSPEQAEQWNRFDMPPVPSGVPLEMEGSLTPLRPRIDVFVRHDGGWRLHGSFTGNKLLAAPLPAEGRAGVLLRDRRWPDVYAWGEADGRAARVRLRWYRTLRIVTTETRRAVAVFVAGAEPIAGGSEIRFVPLGLAIACLHGEESGACATLTEMETSADLRAASTQPRILRVDAGPVDAGVLAPGTTNVRARTIAVTPLRAGEWMALPLPAGERWANAVVDCRTADAAVERVNGAALPPLPSYFTAAPQRLRSVTVRAVVGKDRDPVEKEARLYFYDANASEPFSSIPIAAASPNPDGLFVADELPSGHYLLRLVSAAADASPVTVSLTSQSPAEVQFASGPLIRGRARRTAGGGPKDPTVVEILKNTQLGKGSLDTAQSMRATTAGDDGSFHLVIPSPGMYRMRITWGAARAQREFELRPGQKEVDLGEIALSSGPIFRGSVAGCGGGIIQLAPLPNVENLQTGFFDFHRVAVDGRGLFFSAELAKGTWAVGAKCGDKAVVLDPATITLPEEGEAIVDFRIVPD